MTSREGDNDRTGPSKNLAVHLDVEDPISLLEQEFSIQLRLCSILEEIADGLPFEVQPSRVAKALPLIQRGHSQHIFLEEQLLFPLLRERARSEDNIEALLAQAEREHVIDEGLSVEISESIEHFFHDGRLRSPDMLGYMFRIHFETQRRHIAWERMTILPLVPIRLTPQDCASLSEQMSRSMEQEGVNGV